MSVIGALASCAISLVVLYPLEVVKSRLQIMQQLLRLGILDQRYNGFVDCVKRIVNQQGYLALYKGFYLHFFIHLIMNIAKYRLNMLLRGKMQANKENDGHFKWFAMRVLKSMFIGSVTIVATYTLSFKHSIAVNDIKGQYKNSVQIQKHVRAQRGFTGLFTGIGISLVGMGLYRILYMTLQESLKSVLQKLIANKELRNFITGHLIAIGTSICCYPFELIRQRMILACATDQKYGSVNDCTQQIWAEKEGKINNFWAGVGVSVVRAVFSSLATYNLTKYVKELSDYIESYKLSICCVYMNNSEILDSLMPIPDNYNSYLSTNSMYSLIAVATIVVTLLVYWTIYKPYTFYLFYKRQKDTLAEFVPLFSTFSRSKNYVQNHHDYYHGILQQKRKNPNLKVAGRNIGSTYMLYILDPVLIQQMFTASDKLIVKHQFQNSFIKTLSPRGLVLSEGNIWKKHRKIFAQGFAYQKIQQSLRIIYDCSQQRIKKLDFQQTIDTMCYFKKAAGGILSKSYFGFDVNEVVIDGVAFPLYLSKLISDLSCEAYGYGFSLLGMSLVKMRLFNSLNELQKRIKKTRDAIRIVVRQQKQMRQKGSDIQKKNMWDLFFDNQETLDEDEVIDQFITFFSDGVYTSGHFMMMFCYYLAVNPQWQQKIREELKNTNEQFFLKQDNLHNLKVVRACIWQTLRLAPPVVTGIERIALCDLKLKQYPLKKDTMVMACHIVNHLDPMYHDNPRQFNPERWLTDSKTLEWTKKYPGVFIPFSIGARNCPGQHFAKAEGTVFLSLLLKKYHISLKKQDYVMKFCQKFLRQPQQSPEITLSPIK